MLARRSGFLSLARVAPVAGVLALVLTLGAVAAGAQSPVPAGQPAATTPAATTAQPGAQPSTQAVPAPAAPSGPAPAAPSGSATGAAKAAPAAPAPPPVIIQGAQQKLDSWAATLDRMDQALRRDGVTDRDLTNIRAEADGIKTEAAGLAGQAQPRINELQEQLASLGGPGGGAGGGKEGEAKPVESEAVKQQREDLERLLAAAQGLAKQAQVTQVRADQVIKSIADTRRARFNSQLFARSPSLLDPGLWVDMVLGLPATGNALTLLIGDWSRLLAQRGGSAAIISLMVGIFAALMLALPFRKALLMRTGRGNDVVDPPELERRAKAAAIVLANFVPPVAAMLLVAFVFDLFDLAPTRIDSLLLSLTLGVAGGTLLYGLSRAIVAPRKTQWRLVPVTDAAASRLDHVFALIAFVMAAGYFLTQLVDALFAPVGVAVIVSGLTALLLAGLTAMVLRIFAQSLSEEGEADAAGEAPVAGNVLWRWLIPLGWVAVVAVFAAVVIGYVGLARILANQIAWGGIVLATLYLMLGLIEEASGHVFQPRSRVGETLTMSMGMAPQTVEQIGVLLSGAGRLLMLLVSALVILSPWGFNSGDMLNNVASAFFGVQFGGFTFSLSTILTAVIILVVGVLLTRGVQSWLEHRFLPRTRLDSGLQISIKTAIGYVGFILAAVLSFSSAGLDLQNLAIVAGALSVGIGLGLQSIVNNFVSGLILLAERPIKAGDLVKIGEDQGLVRKINVRSTEIETFDRASLIVPNSSLITGTVKNWMHRDATGRVLINVSVAIDTDPELMRQILLDCAQAHELVLAFPEPKVFLVNIGEKSLDFRLTGTIANVSQTFAVESDLRLALMNRLREARVAMPGGVPIFAALLE